MTRFCPSCDATVEVAASAPDRCPICHKAVVDAAVAAAPPRRLPWLAIGAAAAFAAALGVAGWRMTAQRGEPAKASSGARAATSPRVGDGWRERFRGAGLKGERGTPPGDADEALKGWARSRANPADVAAQLKAFVKPGGLQAVALSSRRRHRVLPTADLWAEVRAGTARPIHSVEAAWLVRAAFDARGEGSPFVAESAGVQTPLMLSRTRIGVRLGDGSIVEPLADRPMAAPKPVADAEVAALWLVLRANVGRLDGAFAAVHEDLSAADAISPGNATVAFIRGVAQIDQKLAEPGVAACEGALAKVEDPLARLFLAEVAMGADQPVKALQRCDEALRAAPAMPEALVTKAAVLMQRVPTLPADQKAASLAEIGALIDEALKATPPPAGARGAKAQWQILSGDEAGAEKLLREAVLTHRDLEAALILAQMLLGRRQAAEAAALFDQVEVPLDDERSVATWVSALAGADQRDKALEVAERAVAASPSSHTVGLLRAQLLAEGGKTKESIAALETLKSGDDGDQVAALQAQLLIQDGQPDRAARQLAALTAHKPADKRLLLLQIIALAKANRVDEADRIAKAAIDDKIALPIEVVEGWLQAGRLDRAQAGLESELANSPFDAKVAATLAVVYTLQGQDAKAAQLHAKAPAGPQRDEARKVIEEAIDAAKAEAARRTGAPGAAAP